MSTIEFHQEIKVEDDLQYDYIVSIIEKWAGEKNEAWRWATWPYEWRKEPFRFWFPKLAYIGRNGELKSPDGFCINTHNDDWSEFVFEDIDKRNPGGIYNYDGISLIFAKEHKGKYVFRGAFIQDTEKTLQKQYVFKKISNRVIVYGKPASRIELPDLLEKQIEIIEKDVESVPDVGYEREAIIRCRVNQSLFREKLLKRYNNKCCICGVNNAEFLLASHIKPWRECNSTEKLDSDNGLLLCPNHDKLFDGGYISFDEEGKILISSKIDTNNCMFMNIQPTMRINYIGKNSEYMTYHRENIFKE